jgi:serine/threonine protein kinase
MIEESLSNPESLPLTLAVRLDKVCDRFERAWKAGQRPRVEDYLANAPEGERRELLRRLLPLEIELRRKGNENPTAKEYEACLPSYIEEIRAIFQDTLYPADSQELTDDSRGTFSFPALSKYELLAEAGQGAMGVVYRARHKILGKYVAIKILLPGRSPERFLREAKLLASVTSPYVVAVHDFEVLPDQSAMLCMDWVEGQNLLQAMRAEGGRLPEDAALPWMRQVCEGMAAAADSGVIHRDLKPSNILNR